MKSKKTKEREEAVREWKKRCKKEDKERERLLLPKITDRTFFFIDDDLPKTKTTRKSFGDMMDPIEIDSTPKRERKQRIARWILLIVVLALGLFVGFRLHKLVNCAEAGGYYQRSHCNGNQCCHEVPYSFK